MRIFFHCDYFLTEEKFIKHLVIGVSFKMLDSVMYSVNHLLSGCYTDIHTYYLNMNKAI